MKPIIQFFILLAVLISTKCIASPVEDLSKLMNPIRTISASFAQMVYDNHGRQIQSSMGTMALSKPGKFRWVTSQPQSQTLIANGNRLWIYDPDLQQVTIRAINSSSGDSPALLLSNFSATLNKDYTVSEMNGTRDEMRWFKLVPKNKNSGYQLIQLGFYNDSVRQMVLQDNLGHSTKIRFNHVKTNSTLGNNLFTFNAPKNVDVLDETHHS